MPIEHNLLQHLAALPVHTCCCRLPLSTLLTTFLRLCCLPSSHPQEMQLFKDRGVKMVDTTCPWVAKVWNSVDQHSRKSYTSVIHGKYSHEETIATASFADTYIIVRDLAEAQMVVDYILKGGDREAFLKHFEKAVSSGFDPDRDLERVGLANQVSGCSRDGMLPAAAFGGCCAAAAGAIVCAGGMCKYGRWRRGCSWAAEQQCSEWRFLVVYWVAMQSC